MIKSLLDDAEARRFGEYLRRTRVNAKVSISAAGGQNRNHWRKYEAGELIPSPPVLRRFAAMCGISEFPLLERAGYLDELLRPIVSLFSYGQDERDRWRKSKSRAQNAWERIGDVDAPFYSYVGMLLTIRGFPRRNEPLALAIARGYNPELDEAGDAALAVSLVPGKLPTAMRVAESLLRNTALSTEARRFIAAEAVHDYGRAIEPELYEALFKKIYQGVVK